MTSINGHRLKSLLHRIINPNRWCQKWRIRQKKVTMNCMYIPPNASDTISYFEETVISGLACQLAAGFTSPALLSDTGGDVRGCLSGSHGVNAAFMLSPVSEEEEDGVLLLLCMIFVSLISPVCPQTRINTRIRSQLGHRQLHSTVCFSLSCLFLFLASVPLLKH